MPRPMHPAEFEVAASNSLESRFINQKIHYLSVFDLEGLRLDLWIKVTGNGAKYPLHDLTYVPAKFEVALSNG